MWRVALRRDLGSTPLTVPQYTRREQVTLQVLAIIFASISILSTALTVYWFLTMRRSFRHHLLMILIQSDTVRALWYMIYAVVALAPGNVESVPLFCQVSGFFTAVGVELSDFAVLMIALHSALYIFNPPALIGQGGLYQYRHAAYGLWIGLPLLMASLAFTNPKEAYVLSGVSCQIPVRPFWYLLALSWIPRYLIFMFILGIDISIYIFIVHRLRAFREGIDASDGFTITRDSMKKEYGESRHGKGVEGDIVSPVPGLAYNGLIPETRQSSVISHRAPKPPISRSRKVQLKTLTDSPILRWSRLSFQGHALNESTFSDMDLVSLHERSTMHTIDHVSLQAAVRRSSITTAHVPFQDISPSSRTSWTSFTTQFNSCRSSMLSIASFLRTPRRNVSFPGDVSVPLQHPELVDSRLNSQTRKKIRKQLRFLFIYPLVYLAMWIIPFILHTLQYSDYYAVNPPFALKAIVTVIMTSQSTVNCWIFNIKERPWRNPSPKKRPFVQILGFLGTLALGEKKLIQPRTIGGKTKNAMEVEAWLAYRRRDEEIAARASETHSAGRSQRQERSWWDDMEDTQEERLSPASASEMADLERHTVAVHVRQL